MRILKNIDFREECGVTAALVTSSSSHDCEIWHSISYVITEGKRNCDLRQRTIHQITSHANMSPVSCCWEFHLFLVWSWNFLFKDTEPGSPLTDTETYLTCKISYNCVSLAWPHTVKVQYVAVDSRAFNQMIDSVSEEWLTLIKLRPVLKFSLRLLGREWLVRKVSLRSEVKSVIP